jgi:MFS superfamily sulfate permease-like transporter
MREFVVRHYEFFLDVSYIVLLALLIFFMNLFSGVQIGLAIACAVVLVWVLHSRDTDKRPCGAEVSGEPISRSRGGFQPH